MKRSDWLLLLIPGAIWGTSFLFIAEALRAIGPNGLTFVRILIGFLTLAFFPSTWRSIDRRDWLAIGALGIVWMAFPLTLFPHAEERVSSAVTGMLNGAGPLLVALVTSSISRKLPGRNVMAGLLIGVVGTLLIASPTMGEGRSSATGVVLILLALVSYAFALTIAQPLQHKYGAVPVIWRAQAVALIVTAPFGIPELAQAHWTRGPLLSLIALGTLGTAIAFVVMATAAGRVGPTRASATVFLIPGVALLLGVVVRHEHVSMLAVAGCVVCVAGALLMRKAQQAPVGVPALAPASFRRAER
jgi:drug/metabolite transporter (DMT)-like permease